MSDAFALLLARTFSPRGLQIALPLALAGITATGALFALIEGHSLGDGLWWAFVTVTTVGYGDVTPETFAGKLLAVALMVGGVGFLLVLAGAIVEHFVTVEVEEHELLRRLNTLSAQVDELTELVREQRGERTADDAPPGGVRATVGDTGAPPCPPPAATGDCSRSVVPREEPHEQPDRRRLSGSGDRRERP